MKCSKKRSFSQRNRTLFQEREKKGRERTYFLDIFLGFLRILFGSGCLLLYWLTDSLYCMLCCLCTEYGTFPAHMICVCVCVYCDIWQPISLVNRDSPLTSGCLQVQSHTNMYMRGWLNAYGAFALQIVRFVIFPLFYLFSHFEIIGYWVCVSVSVLVCLCVCMCAFVFVCVWERDTEIYK